MFNFLKRDSGVDKTIPETFPEPLKKQREYADLEGSGKLFGSSKNSITRLYDSVVENCTRDNQYDEVAKCYKTEFSELSGFKRVKGRYYAVFTFKRNHIRGNAPSDVVNKFNKKADNMGLAVDCYVDPKDCVRTLYADWK